MRKPSVLAAMIEALPAVHAARGEFKALVEAAELGVERISASQAGEIEFLPSPPPLDHVSVTLTVESDGKTFSAHVTSTARPAEREELFGVMFDVCRQRMGPAPDTSWPLTEEDHGGEEVQEEEGDQEAGAGEAATPDSDQPGRVRRGSGDLPPGRDASDRVRASR